MTAIDIINESFSDVKPANFIRKEKSGRLSYFFQVKDLMFKFDIYYDDKNANIAFSSDKEKTNDIAVTKIAFATFVSIVKDAMKTIHPDIITMDPSSKSRYRVYKNLANKVAYDFGYSVEARPEQSYNGHIILTKNK